MLPRWQQLTDRLAVLGSKISEAVSPAIHGLLSIVGFALTSIGNLFGWLFDQVIRFLDLLGLAPDEAAKAAKAAELADVDARNKKMAEAQAADEKKALLAKGQHHEQKGFRGGLEEWAKKIQDAAFGDKNALQKQQLAANQQQVSLQSAILQALQKNKQSATAALAT